MEFSARGVTSARRALSLDQRKEQLGDGRASACLLSGLGTAPLGARRRALGPLQRGRDQLCWVWPITQCAPAVLSVAPVFWVRHSHPNFPGWPLALG